MKVLVRSLSSSWQLDSHPCFNSGVVSNILNGVGIQVCTPFILSFQCPFTLTRVGVGLSVSPRERRLGVGDGCCDTNGLAEVCMELYFIYTYIFPPVEESKL